MTKTVPIYGLMAEFKTPEELLEAAHRTHEAGYRRIDAFAPFPIEGLSEAVGFHRTWLPLVVLIGGILGGVSGFGLQYYA
ncbi:MAG: quinol:electron acceptor oxidoreductase subunit ActD, partial [Candidatus Acidiferrales bacterium]